MWLSQERKVGTALLKSIIYLMEICEIRIGPLETNSLPISVMTMKMDAEFHVKF